MKKIQHPRHPRIIADNDNPHKTLSANRFYLSQVMTHLSSMKWNIITVSRTLSAIISIFCLLSCENEIQTVENRFHESLVDVKSDDLRFVWKDSDGQRFASIANWNESVKSNGENLIFAMNGGMYEADGSPKGLFIEKGITVSKIDLLEEGYGNFYIQPNGVLYTTGNKAGICKSSEFNKIKNVVYATQSGPMLLYKGKINEQFRPESNNKHIRNGVGLLADGRLLFAMSKTKVTFHEFADYFKKKGCQQALYLDGFVSRMYAPSDGIEQQDGDFAVIIGVVKK